MSIEVVTRAIESKLEPEVLYRRLCDISFIPRWAPVFADKVEPVQGSVFRVTKGGESFEMELIANEAALTVDYLRSMPGGRRGGAYIRVMPKPMGGSVVAMSVPVGPTSAPEDVARVLEDELEALVKGSTDGQ